MARWGDSVKRREWSERLRRFARWVGTVAEFCDSERVSPPSFYQWRRKLAASGVEVDVDIENGRCSAPDRHLAQETSRTFIPVQLVGATSSATTVEIELPNGTLIRLPASDRPLLTAAILAAGQVTPPAGGQSALREGEPEEAPC